MSLSINTNIAALQAVSSVEQSDQSLQTSIQRLSTGLRINSSSDDPSGYVISQGLKGQIAGLAQASQNAQTAMNMAKTAGGAMQQISALLQSMRSLAVTSANSGVVTSTELQANQSQITSTIASINQIAQSTQFGTQPLLDGTAGVRANITDATDVSSLYLGNTFGGYAVQSGPVTIQKTTAATEAQVTTNQTYANANTTMAASSVLVLNGTTIQVSAGETLQSVVNSLNAASGSTGVSASIVAAGAKVAVQLTQANYGSQYAINLVDAGHVLNTSTIAASGTDAVFSVSAPTTHGVQTVTFTGGRTPGATGLQLTDGAGNSLTLTAAGNAGLAAATPVATVTAGSVQFQIGANASQTVSYSLPSMFASNLGTNAVPGQSIATIDVSSSSGATAALQVIDDAINQVSTQEGQLGSFQSSVLASTQSADNIANQNLTAASGSITDTDIAAETTAFTQNQVLEQSGLSILAQANQNPAQLLSLLKNL